MAKGKIFGNARRKFTAGMLANLLYLFVGGAFAGNFFANLGLAVKSGIVAGAILFALASILLYPSTDSKSGREA